MIRRHIKCGMFDALHFNDAKSRKECTPCSCMRKQLMARLTRRTANDHRQSQNRQAGDQGLILWRGAGHGDLLCHLALHRLGDLPWPSQLGLCCLLCPEIRLELTALTAALQGRAQKCTRAPPSRRDTAWPSPILTARQLPRFGFGRRDGTGTVRRQTG